MKRTRFLFSALVGLACGWSASPALARDPAGGTEMVPPGAFSHHGHAQAPQTVTNGGSGYAVHGGTTYEGGSYQGGGPVADGDVVYGGEWHSGYYHTMWGRPVALVVPPQANYQTNYAWGVGNTTVTPIYPQYYGPSYVPTVGYTPRPGYLPTPYWPSDTRQFGVYYIRGPW